jgi:hypothetical protein
LIPKVIKRIITKLNILYDQPLVCENQLPNEDHGDKRFLFQQNLRRFNSQ